MYCLCIVHVYVYVNVDLNNLRKINLALCGPCVCIIAFNASNHSCVSAGSGSSLPNSKLSKKLLTKLPTVYKSLLLFYKFKLLK